MSNVCRWLAPFYLILLGWVFVPFYLKSEVFTMPEFLERRFNRKIRLFLAGLSIVAYIFTKISVALYSGILICQVVLEIDNPWLSSIAIVIATGLYVGKIQGKLSNI
jgi:SSS family solute:Na+ symporter